MSRLYSEKGIKTRGDEKFPISTSVGTKQYFLLNFAQCKSFITWNIVNIFPGLHNLTSNNVEADYYETIRHIGESLASLEHRYVWFVFKLSSFEWNNNMVFEEAPRAGGAISRRARAAATTRGPITAISSQVVTLQRFSKITPYGTYATQPVFMESVRSP